MFPTRRDFIKTTGFGVLAFTMGSKCLWLTPAQAKEDDIPLQILTKKEAGLIESATEVLLPGASDAGIVHFIDQQLSSPLEDCLMMVKYLGVPHPFDGFYRGGLAALNKTCLDLYQKELPELNPDQAKQIIKTISANNPEAWQGPPAPLFYYVLRSDAIDVVYGTQEGFEKLGIPYFPHIEPASPW